MLTAATSFTCGNAAIRAWSCVRMRAESLSVGLVLRIRQRDVEEHAILGLEPAIDIQNRAEAPDQKSRADEQHERQRDLDAHERAAQPNRAADCRPRCARPRAARRRCRDTACGAPEPVP